MGYLFKLQANPSHARTIRTFTLRNETDFPLENTARVEPSSEDDDEEELDLE